MFASTQTVVIRSTVSNSAPTTATLWNEPEQLFPGYYPTVIIIESQPPREEWRDLFEGEPLWRRRWRLSLEAIDRYKRLARRSRLRVRSQWRRTTHVARVCAQSARWRVLAS